MELHQESVELGLGQGVGPFVLDRVLGGEDPERVGEDDRLVADRDLAFLHRLQQGALDLGRGPVDLVRQDDRGHDRPGPDVESPGRRSVDLGAGEVGREQVGGELDSPEGEVEGAGECPDRSGLGQPGNALDQDVAARQKGDDQPFQQRALADDLALEATDQVVEQETGRTW